MDPPTLSGFLDFIRNNAGVPTQALPDNSPVITMAFNVAMAIVNTDMALVSCLIYSLAVYNLGMSNIVNFAPDVQGSPTKDVNGVSLPYFQALRASLGTANFVAGVVNSTSDEGTSMSLQTISIMQDLTLANLQQLKDPWGRQYLAFAQTSGSLWGVS